MFKLSSENLLSLKPFSKDFGVNMVMAMTMSSDVGGDGRVVRWCWWKLPGSDNNGGYQEVVAVDDVY